MEEAKALAQHKQHSLQKQQQGAQSQQTQQQQFMLLQHLHKQQQAQQMPQASAISRFPSNIDAHLRSLRPPINNLQLNNPNNPNPSPNPNSVPNLHQHNVGGNSQQQSQQSSTQQRQQQSQQKMVRPVNLELQMAYQDAWRVCHPDFKRRFSSLEDACDRVGSPRIRIKPQM